MRPIWLTLDAVAGAASATSRSSSVSRMPRNLRQVFDSIRYFWIFYIVGFNAERQERCSTSRSAR